MLLMELSVIGFPDIGMNGSQLLHIDVHFFPVDFIL